MTPDTVNEPKKDEILVVARQKWPAATSFKVNQRKHTLAVIFPGNLRQFNFMLKADSHRALLAMIQGFPAPKTRNEKFQTTEA